MTNLKKIILTILFVLCSSIIIILLLDKDQNNNQKPSEVKSNQKPSEVESKQETTEDIIKHHIDNLKLTKEFCRPCDKNFLNEIDKLYKSIQGEGVCVSNESTEVIKDLNSFLERKNYSFNKKENQDCIKKLKYLVVTFELTLKSIKNLQSIMSNIKKRIKDLKIKNYNDLRISRHCIMDDEIKALENFTETDYCAISVGFLYINEIMNTYNAFLEDLSNEDAKKILDKLKTKGTVDKFNSICVSIEEFWFHYENMNIICDNYTSWRASYKAIENYFNTYGFISLGNEWDSKEKWEINLEKMREELEHEFKVLALHNNTSGLGEKIMISEKDFVEPL